MRRPTTRCANQALAASAGLGVRAHVDLIENNEQIGMGRYDATSATVQSAIAILALIWRGA
jgi:hypothetical protein